MGYLEVILLWYFVVSVVITPLGLLPCWYTRFGLLGAMSEAVRFIAGFDDVAMVSKSVQQGGCHLGIAEYVGPLGKSQVGGNDDAGTLV